MGYDDYLNYLHYEMNKLFSAREKQCITTKIAVLALVKKVKMILKIGM